MKGYTRDSVDMHSDGFRPSKPAIKIKSYHFPHAGKIESRFKCTESIAEKAGEYAFNCACRDFWESLPEITGKYFPRVKFYQAGRSGGWIEFELEKPDKWDGQTLNRWGIMERRIKESIRWYESEEYIFDMIESNKWNLPNAREYNFYEDAKGNNHCIAEEINKIKETIPPALQREFGIK